MLPRTSREMELEGGRAPSEFVHGGVRVYCVCCGCAVCGVRVCGMWCECVLCVLCGCAVYGVRVGCVQGEDELCDVRACYVCMWCEGVLSVM